MKNSVPQTRTLFFCLLINGKLITGDDDGEPLFYWHKNSVADG